MNKKFHMNNIQSSFFSSSSSSLLLNVSFAVSHFFLFVHFDFSQWGGDPRPGSPGCFCGPQPFSGYGLGGAL